MTDAVLMLAVTDIKPACEGIADVVDRLKAAMAKAQDFWLLTDDQLRLKAAVAATMLTGTEADKDRLQRSWRALASLSAAISGLDVDILSAMEAAGNDAIPIMRMWQEAKEMGQ